MKNEDEDKAALVLVGQLVRDRKERCKAKAKAKKKKNVPMLQQRHSILLTYSNYVTTNNLSSTTTTQFLFYVIFSQDSSRGFYIGIGRYTVTVDLLT